MYTQYLFSIVSLSLCFAALLLNIRFLFSKRSYVWIGAVVLTLAMALMNLLLLLAIASPASVSEVKSFAFELSKLSIIPSGVWCVCIVLFRIRTNEKGRMEADKKEKDYEKKYISRKTKPLERKIPEGQVRTRHLPEADLSDEDL